MMNQEQEITQAVKKFRSDVDKIRNSDNPYFSDPKVVDYEIKAKRAELDAKVTELSHAYDVAMTQEVESAEQVAKSSRFNATDTQRKQAEYALDSFVADVTLARDDNGKHAAYQTLVERLDDMGHAELAHIRLQLPSVLSRVNGDAVALKKLQSLNETLSALRTPEQERLDELKAAKRVGAAQAYSRLKMTHPAYSHLPTNQNSGHFKGSL